MLDKYFYILLHFIMKWAGQLNAWAWRKHVKILSKKMKQAILQALEDKYNAQISEADATIKIYLNHSVGIGEHPQHIEDIDKQLQKIVDASEKIKELQSFKL